ncbi:MAG: hypothetical protein OXC46_01345 [Thaumarchaeota archaeon]|nr:hypothetical protein [Nitrososphaerota archaeon]
MMHDGTLRKSLEGYIRNRIREIPSEISQTFPNVKQVWKCEGELDFLYGYYVGKIEEGALHYLLKATRASAGGFVDTFEIRGIIETFRTPLIDAIKKATAR